jgi:hypothetical protein
MARPLGLRGTTYPRLVDRRAGSGEARRFCRRGRRGRPRLTQVHDRNSLNEAFHKARTSDERSLLEWLWRKRFAR